MATTKKSGLLAGILSFFIPGSGQLYKGHLVSALIWFFVVPAGYFLFYIPGILLHALCVISAVIADSK